MGWTELEAGRRWFQSGNSKAYKVATFQRNLVGESVHRDSKLVSSHHDGGHADDLVLGTPPPQFSARFLREMRLRPACHARPMPGVRIGPTEKDLIAQSATAPKFPVAAGYTDGVIAYRPLLNFFFLVLVVVIIWVIARISK
jgi:hypothetical protein